MRWSAAPRHQPARPRSSEAAAALGLVAAALRSGVGSVEALEAVADVDERPGGSRARGGGGRAPLGPDARRGVGARGSGLGGCRGGLARGARRRRRTGRACWRRAAERMRAEESRRVEAAVQRAGVLLVLPLGACFLPGLRRHHGGPGRPAPARWPRAVTAGTTRRGATRRAADWRAGPLAVVHRPAPTAGRPQVRGGPRARARVDAEWYGARESRPGECRGGRHDGEGGRSGREVPGHGCGRWGRRG